MSALSELQSKAEAAQQRFGELGERQREVDLRLRNLNGLVEDGLKHKQSADLDLADEIKRLTIENESLRQMVESLVAAADGPDAEALTRALVALEQNTASLVEDRGPAAADVGTEAVEDSPIEEIEGDSPAGPYVVSSIPEADFGADADIEGAFDAPENPADITEEEPANAFSKIRKHIGRGR